MGTTSLSQVDKDKLFSAVRRAWSVHTSVHPAAWTPDNRAKGQCAVTAVLLQDWLGGDLLRAVVGDESHYWNRVGGEDIDLTQHQFTPSQLAGIDPAGIERRSRNYVLDFPDTRRRYLLLKSRVEAILNGERRDEASAD